MLDVMVQCVAVADAFERKLGCDGTILARRACETPNRFFMSLAKNSPEPPPPGQAS